VAQKPATENKGMKNGLTPEINRLNAKEEILARTKPVKEKRRKRIYRIPESVS